MAEGEASNEHQPTIDYDEFVAPGEPIAPAQPTKAPFSPFADKRWEVKGALAAAAITAVVGGVVTIAVALINHSPAENAPPSAPIPTTSVAVNTGDAERAGDFTQVQVGDDGQVRISGTADPKVKVVVVVITPNASAQSWTGTTTVASDLTWTVTVETGQTLHAGAFSVQAYFRGADGSNVGSAISAA